MCWVSTVDITLLCAPLRGDDFNNCFWFDPVESKNEQGSRLRQSRRSATLVSLVRMCVSVSVCVSVCVMNFI